jgi:hypothetical protein
MQQTDETGENSLIDITVQELGQQLAANASKLLTTLFIAFEHAVQVRRSKTER